MGEATNERAGTTPIVWEQALLFSLAAVVGLYAGIAAGLFTTCIRTAQIALFRFPELWKDLVDPGRGWARRFAGALLHAPWHLEFAVLSGALFLCALLVAWLSERRHILVPVFEARRLRAAAAAGAFGLVLYYPLVLLGAFNATFSDGEGGLFAMLEAAPAWLRVLAPALGGLAAGLIIRYVSPESGGHGVVEVIEAVHGRPQGLRGRVALWKSLAAGATIGSGGSAGREGPVVHLGGAVAASLSRFLSLPRERAAVLVACGAGAGIAASFQAPLAGSMFALEIVLGDFAAPSLAPVVLSAVIATVASRALLHGGSDLRMVQWSLQSPAEVGLCALLGALAGLCALLYLRAVDGVHALFEGHAKGPVPGALGRLPAALRPALGGLCVGFLGLFVPRALGTGIESMNAALGGQLALGALLAALAAKILATALTLGSGAPGGNFFPAVFAGAMLGGAFGQAAHLLLPTVAARPEVYAAVGMGAFVAGSTVAPLTGVLMMLELTASEQIVLPLLAACGIAAALVHRALGGSVYALKLRARGINVGGRERILRALSVAQAAEKVEPLPEALPWEALVQRIAQSGHAGFPLLDAGGALSGLVLVRQVRAALLEPLLRDLTVARDLSAGMPLLLQQDEDLETALHKLGAAGAAVVLDEEGRPSGVVTREAILEAWHRAG